MICFLGAAVCERDTETHTFLVMTPDGQVEGCITKRQAEAIVRRWAKANADPKRINVVKVEWR